MGWCGLALTWHRAEHLSVVGTHGGAAVLSIGAALVCLVVFAGYGTKIICHTEAVTSDMDDAARVTFLAGIPVTLMLLPAIALSMNSGLATSLFVVGIWCAGAVLHVMLAMVFFHRWVVRPLPEAGGLRAATPAWFVPTAGMIVAPFAAVSFGFATASLALLALGTLTWITLLPFVVHRLVAGDPLPSIVLPGVFVLAAPAALISLSVAALGGPASVSNGLFVVAISFACVATLLVAWRSGDLYRTGFTLGWWSCTFPLAALAGASLQFHASVQTGITHALALTLLLTATGAIALISILTLRMAIQRR